MQSAASLDLVLHSRGDTRRLGRRLAACLVLGDLVLLEGDLGAGKTFLARAIARGMGVPTEIRVTSPTFDLVHDLPARVPLLHVDLYRLDDASSLNDLGLTERIGADAIVLIEWGLRFAQALGGEGLWLSLRAAAGVTRYCRIDAHGERGLQLLERLKQSLAEQSLHGRACSEQARI
jgi:tRNA threonylcarbamoyladenosine biosynthesis protein TsaE